MIDSRAPVEVIEHAGDWPLPNFDYDNTRNSHTKIDSRNVATLQEGWRYEPEPVSSIFGFLVSNPLVLGSRVYFQDLQSNVHALDRNTGALAWLRKFDVRSSGPNGVAIGWGKIYFQRGNTAIHAIRLDNGEDVWTYPLELTPSEGIDIQPTVFDRQVFASTVPVSQTSGVYARGSRGVLLSVDAEAGTKRWSFDTVLRESGANPEANGGGGAWYPPLIDAKRGLSYWGTGNPAPFPDDGSRPGPNLYTSSVVAVSLDEGKLIWHYQDVPHDVFDWDFQSTPVRARAAATSGGDLVIGSGKSGAVAALDPDTGRLLWRTRVGFHEHGELNGEGKGPIQESVWIYPGAFGGVLSALAYADGVVYVPSSDLPMAYDGTTPRPEFEGGRGAVTALDVRDGRVLWVAATRGACYGAATVANDLVFTVDEHGRVYAFARETGAEVWHYDAPGGVNAPLVITGDELIVSSGVRSGVVVALKLAATGDGLDAAAAASPAATDAAALGDPTFSSVYREIVRGTGCAEGPACHSSSVAGDLDMSSRAVTYNALVGVAAKGTRCSSSGLLRVAPSDPERSLLLHKVRDDMPDCGGPMPPGSKLSPQQIAQLERWIALGAPDD